MIDFRYHIVSLIAVFLALALGIVVGTTQLNGAVLDDLRGQVRGLTEDKRALEQDVRALQGQVRGGDQVTASLAPKAVAGTLSDVRIVIVATAQAGGLKDDVQQILEQAGAEVTGRLQLTDDYSDPRRAADLRSFVTGGGQPAGFQLPESEDAGVLAGSLLSYVLVAGEDGAAEPAAVNQVLSGFASLQMLRLESAEVTPADYAVVLSAAPIRGESAPDRLKTLIELVAALDETGRGAVVAGTEAAAGSGGLLGEIREDGALASIVSTVDDANRPAGQIASVYALRQQAAGEAGQYGRADNAEAPFPPAES